MKEHIKHVLAAFEPRMSKHRLRLARVNNELAVSQFKPYGARASGRRIHIRKVGLRTLVPYLAQVAPSQSSPPRVSQGSQHRTFQVSRHKTL